MAWRATVKRHCVRLRKPKPADFIPMPAIAAPDSLSDEDRALVAKAKQRPVDPAVWREIQRKGLGCYV